MKLLDQLKAYFNKIFDINKTGDAREETYYSALEDLLETYCDSIEKKKFHITTLPKKTEAGNPDFRIWDGKQHIVGYIEAKAPTTEHLDQVETTAQLKRYLHIFPNLILTNFFEFRLYRNGALVDRVSIARPFMLHKLKTIPRQKTNPILSNCSKNSFPSLCQKSMTPKLWQWNWQRGHAF